MDRRQMLMAMGGAAASLAWVGKGAALAVHEEASLAAALDRIEARVGGRLGVAMLDTATGRHFARRGDERFPMCSTFKFILTAAVLHTSESGTLPLPLARPVRVPAGTLVGNSPVTQRRAGGTMTIADLCQATMTQSDNEAANLLLDQIGGPEAVTRYVRGLGDTVTRLDRPEPVMNDVAGADHRDSTSPSAMLATMRTLLLGHALTAGSRATLTGWMVANRTGGARLRAGLPHGWRVGDKTGTGEHGTANDIAIAWPAPGRPPILITSYLHDSGAEQARTYAALADVGRAVAAAVQRR